MVVSPACVVRVKLVPQEREDERSLQLKQEAVGTIRSASRAQEEARLLSRAISGTKHRLETSPGTKNKRARSTKTVAQDWKSLSRKLWAHAPYKVFNIATSQDREKLTSSMLENLLDKVKGYRLRNDTLDDVDEALNSLKHAGSIEALCDILRELYPLMQTCNRRDRKQCELGYIWTAFDTIRELWDAINMSDKWKEGWFASNVHGPVLATFKSIEGTIYQMTDIRGRASRLSGQDYRHDSILHHQGLDLDLVSMEAKPTQQRGGRRKDMSKLEMSLAGNLQLALALVPTDRKEVRDKIRAHAVMCSGYQITLLEARRVDDCILIYSIGTSTVPMTVELSHQFAELISLMILFKRRVELNIATIIQARSTATDLRSSIGSNNSSDAVLSMTNSLNTSKILYENHQDNPDDSGSEYSEDDDDEDGESEPEENDQEEEEDEDADTNQFETDESDRDGDDDEYLTDESEEEED
ncbi:hypothetical protein BGZ49_003234 [Haplosporangium sp. Z 27]|nr:hypothetical protein BGZ49_003234 [Haplosporangium sp. Z 27]